MGVTCQKFLSEEESITSIFSNLLLKDIPVEQCYEEFQQCIIKDELDFFKYTTFVSKIIGSNSYQDLQKIYFENLWKEKENRIHKLGTLIILIAKGSDSEKVELLLRHFNTFYFTNRNINKSKAMENAVKSFLHDFIYINTTLCYSSFRIHIGSDNMKHYADIWNEKRKDKLMYTMYQNYESVRHKYHRKKLSDEYVSGNLRTSASINTEEATNNDNIVLKEFLDLVDTQLDGDFIREWLHEDYMREKAGDRICV
jgi:hypothetical protein